MTRTVGDCALLACLVAFVLVQVSVGQDVGAARPDPLSCGPVCEIFCLYGNVLDARGCPTCRCNPGPVCQPAVCPLIKCAFGLQRDENGCEICQCNTGPVCKPAVCPTIKCAHGLKKDANGCEICQCNTDPPICVVCLLACPPGTVLGPLDERGCPRCSCVPISDPVCPLVKCRPCQNGHVFVNGCQTCQCKPPTPVCPLLQCDLACPLGQYEVDSNGCQLCRCKRTIVGCNARCRNFCLTGTNRPSADCRCLCRGRQATTEV